MAVVYNDDEDDKRLKNKAALASLARSVAGPDHDLNCAAPMADTSTQGGDRIINMTGPSKVGRLRIVQLPTAAGVVVER
jgi:hypothetical protein